MYQCRPVHSVIFIRFSPVLTNTTQTVQSRAPPQFPAKMAKSSAGCVRVTEDLNVLKRTDDKRHAMQDDLTYIVIM